MNVSMLLLSSMSHLRHEVSSGQAEVAALLPERLPTMLSVMGSKGADVRHALGAVQAELVVVKEELTAARAGFNNYSAPDPATKMDPGLSNPLLALAMGMLKSYVDTASLQATMAWLDFGLLLAGIVGSPALALALLVWAWRTGNASRFVLACGAALLAHPATTLYAVALLVLWRSYCGVRRTCRWLVGLCRRAPAAPTVNVQPPAPERRLSWGDWAFNFIRPSANEEPDLESGGDEGEADPLPAPRSRVGSMLGDVLNVMGGR
jgi:hypothetical protein